MADLKDYSGAFNPDLKLEDFSKEALIRMLKATSNLYLGAWRFFYNPIKEKYGEQVADELSCKMWDDATLYQFKLHTRALNITGNDVASVLKYFQFSPDLVGMEVKQELKNENLGVMTIRNCPGVKYSEKYNDVALIEHTCQDVAVPLFHLVATWFNPNMKCTPLMLPPRKGKEDPSCVWEFRLEPGA